MPFKKCNSIDSNCKPTFWRKNQSTSLWFLWKVAPSIFRSSWSCLYPSADDQSLLWKQPRYSFNLLGLSLFGVKWWPWLAWNNNKKFISIPSLTLLLLFEWRRSQCNGRGMRGATNLTRNSKIILLRDKGHIWDGFLFIKGTCFIWEGLIWGVLWKAKSA